MSAIIQGGQLRTLLFGDQVIKTAQALPNNTTSTLFTVAGGNVLVTSLLGVVSTACSATAQTIALGLAPSGGGTAEHAGICTAGTVTSLELGCWLSPGTSGGAAMVTGGHAGNTVELPTPFVAPAGTVTWTTTANSVTGAVSWYLTYIPLDTGASVS